ncbi:MAG: hypothetical protein QW587_05605 [Candidatus Bathyarchaeia archaeon]
MSLLEANDFTVDCDAVIAAVMERLEIEEVYSNDHHFDRVPSVKRVLQ